MGMISPLYRGLERFVNIKENPSIQKGHYYLVHTQKGWSVERLNTIQYLLRKIFGCYKNTHGTTLIKNICQEFTNRKYLGDKTTSENTAIEIATKADLFFKKIYQKHKMAGGIPPEAFPSNFLKQHVFSIELFKQKLLEIGFSNEELEKGLFEFLGNSKLNNLEKLLISLQTNNLADINLVVTSSSMPPKPFLNPADESEVDLNSSFSQDQTKKYSDDAKLLREVLNNKTPLIAFIQKGYENELLVKEKNLMQKLEKKYSENLKIHLLDSINQNFVEITYIFSIDKKPYIFSGQWDLKEDKFICCFSSLTETIGKNRYQKVCQILQDNNLQNPVTV